MCSFRGLLLLASGVAVAALRPTDGNGGVYAPNAFFITTGSPSMKKIHNEMVAKAIWKTYEPVYLQKLQEAAETATNVANVARTNPVSKLLYTIAIFHALQQVKDFETLAPTLWLLYMVNGHRAVYFVLKCVLAAAKRGLRFSLRIAVAAVVSIAKSILQAIFTNVIGILMEATGITDALRFAFKAMMVGGALTGVAGYAGGMSFDETKEAFKQKMVEGLAMLKKVLYYLFTKAAIVLGPVCVKVLEQLVKLVQISLQFVMLLIRNVAERVWNLVPTKQDVGDHLHRVKQFVLQKGENLYERYRNGDNVKNDLQKILNTLWDILKKIAGFYLQVFSTETLKAFKDGDTKYFTKAIEEYLANVVQELTALLNSANGALFDQHELKASIQGAMTQIGWNVLEAGKGVATSAGDKLAVTWQEASEKVKTAAAAASAEA